MDKVGCLKLTYQQGQGLEESTIFFKAGTDEKEAPVKKRHDYYPFGLTFNSYQRPSGKKNDFLYNGGSERISDLDLQVDMTRFRVLDPAIGRWWQIDPRTDELAGLTPYNSMFNNPIRYNDPKGDCPPDDPNCNTNLFSGSDLLPKGVNSYSEVTPIGDDNITISPVTDPVISSEYGTRDEPTDGASTNHKGIDIVQKEEGEVDGADVVAPLNGIVIAVKNKDDDDGAGNRIHIKADKDGKTHSFFHLQDESFGEGLKSGQSVARGTKIGQVGTTGTSTASHLHYEIRDRAGGGSSYSPRNNNSGLRNAPTTKQARATKPRTTRTGFFTPIGQFKPPM